MSNSFKTSPGLNEKQLSIYTLGNFRVLRGNIDLTETHKNSIKIWDLLRYLITYRDKYLTPEKILESLWPEAEYVDPKRTLRALIFRLRKIIEPDYQHSENHLISFSHGCYIFNACHLLYLDTVDFDHVYLNALNLQSSNDAKHIEGFKKVISLHKGIYMSDSQEYDWIVLARIHFNRIYMNSIAIVTNLLIKSKHYGIVVELCEEALKFNFDDENLQYTYIHALMKKGEVIKAQNHFEYVKKKFEMTYDLSNDDYIMKIQELFNKHMETNYTYQTDDRFSKSNLNAKGPNICDLEFYHFNKQLEKSRDERQSTCVFYASLTLFGDDKPNNDSPSINHLMDHFRIVLVSNLRKGDLIAQNGSNQYLLSLAALNLEHAHKALDRIVDKFSLLEFDSCFTIIKHIEYDDSTNLYNDYKLHEPYSTYLP